MWTKCLWLILVGTFFHYHWVFTDDDCQVTEKPKLQVVFVVDYVMKRGGHLYFKVQNDTAFYLIDFIKENFKAEFAVTGFADYPDTAGPRKVDNP